MNKKEAFFSGSFELNLNIIILPYKVNLIHGLPLYFLSFNYLFNFHLVCDILLIMSQCFRFQWVRRWCLWKHYRDFFPVHLIKTAELDPSKNYILGYHPHGVLSAGAFCHFSTEGSDFSKVVIVVV